MSSHSPAWWKNTGLAHKLQIVFRSGVIKLSNAERTLVLAALDDPSAGLEELRAQLVENPAWRSLLTFELTLGRAAWLV